jgi:UDP-N-acetylglucosamine 2-epimerase (non-hydrolysing)
VVRPFALVTYHPVTAGGPDPKVGARQVYDAVAATCGTALLTRPGPDAGRAEVDEELVAATARHPHLVAANTLGVHYLPVLAAADVVVGNSSSGIIEAATFGVPVVNVGDRQLGRERNDNVVDVSEETDAIAEGIARALTPEFRDKARAAGNRYGDGHAAARVVDLVRRAVDDPNLARKPFVDLERHP